MRGTSRAFLLFEHLKMLSHCLLGHVVSGTKFAVILIFVLYTMYLLLLYFLFIIDLSNWIMICFGMFYFMFILLEFIEILGFLGF